MTAFLSGGALPPSVRGRTTDLMLHEVDWLPTFLSLAGARPRSTIDGVSQWRALTVPGTAPPRTKFIYNIDPVGNLSAIRVGDWKYIDGTKQSPDVEPASAAYLPLCPKAPDDSGASQQQRPGVDCLADLHSKGPSSALSGCLSLITHAACACPRAVAVQPL